MGGLQDSRHRRVLDEFGGIVQLAVRLRKRDVVMRLWRRAWLAGGALVLVSPPVYAAETVTYTYDALGRLVTVVHSGTVNAGQTTTYTLGATDSRTNVVVTGASH